MEQFIAAKLPHVAHVETYNGTCVLEGESVLQLWSQLPDKCAERYVVLSLWRDITCTIHISYCTVGWEISLEIILFHKAFNVSF